MKAKPILFNTEMVRALLEGRKTQTRRVVKPQPHEKDGLVFFESYNLGFTRQGLKAIDLFPLGCPFGKVGDYLWVRETLGLRSVINHTTNKIEVWANYKASNPNEAFPWTGRTDTNIIPSIHMPRWASRLTLKITDIKVERLQDISCGDCMDEGCLFPNIARETDPVAWYRDLWKPINSADSWEDNPYVWVINFKVIKKNVYEVLK